MTFPFPMMIVNSGRFGGGGPATDPDFASVKLLLGFEGADAGVATSDESGAAHGAATFAGNAQLDTAQFKFGASSLLLDGTGDAITFPDSADWDFTGNFTVECFARSNNIGLNSMLVAQWTNFPNRAWHLNFNGNVPEWTVSLDGSASTTDLSSSTLVTTGVWYHLAVDYDGTKYRLYLNGVMVASSTTHRTINPSGAVLSVGANGNTSGFNFNGWIDEVRITKGVARYASDSGFTAPTLPFPRS